MGNFLLGSIAFLAAFLLFAIELIIAKIFLPGYGGSYLVWGASIVFFQAVLLLGYWFSHKFIGLLGWGRYRFVHLALLVLPLLCFPGRDLKPISANPSVLLVLDVFLQLAVSIGPVFFVLSTMSIATQMWLSRSKLETRLNPYALYAVSNLGSFAALLSYPFLIELNLEISQQVAWWRIMYIVLIALNALAFMAVRVAEESGPKKEAKPVAKETALRWIVLGAGASMAFLSVNTMITYELPPVPLFWIFPLGIYLLSFVLNFKKQPWCPPWIVKGIAPIIGMSALYYFFIQKYDLPPLVEFAAFLFILFVLCMYCQYELIRTKPKEEENLTGFYFLISLGSFFGGIVTTWIIPLVSVSMIEYLCALIIIAAAAIPQEFEARFSSRALRILIYINLLYFVWSAFFIKYNIFAIVALFWFTWQTYKYLSRFRYGVLAALLLLLVCLPVQEKMWDRKATDSTWKIRNYYGIHEIVDADDVRWLYHGRTLHGAQFLSDLRLMQPITYYGPHSGVWDVLRSPDFNFKNLAVIGLGTGTMSTFLRPDQTFDIFELDPDVYTIAKEKFYFLRHCPAPVRVFLGDARLSLKKVHDRLYDLLLIDAFGGDTIPVHLLTKEVFQEYRSHLTQDGAIVIHVSNRYVDLVPVLARVARSVGAEITYKQSVTNGKYYTGSYWMFISWDNRAVGKMLGRPGWVTVGPHDFEGRVWSDGYSSILPSIRLDYLIETIKHFKFIAW